MGFARKLGRIEHLILAALLANGLSAVTAEAKKHKSKHSKSDSTESTDSTASTSTAAPASTTAAPTTAPAASATASPTAASATATAATPASTAKPAATAGTTTVSIGVSTTPPVATPIAVTPSTLTAPRLDVSPQAQNQKCYVPRRIMTFQEEALIVPGPATQRWNAGRVLYGLGTGVSMASTAVASIGGIYIAATGVTTPLSEPGPAMALAGSVGNLTGTALLISGMAAQHSALGMLGKDSGRAKFIAGVVFGVLGLASVGAGYIVGGMDIPNKDVINYSVGYGGTLLLTTASSILISDARNLRQIWDSLGMRPGVPTPYPAPPPPPPGAYPPPQAGYPQQQAGFPPPE